MSPEKFTMTKRGPAPASAPYTSRIIKAGALLDDTKALLSEWDLNLPARENLARIRRENIFGKASRSRVEDILIVFRQRYLTESEVTRALVTLVKRRLPSASVDRILYFHAARADRLLYDTVAEVLLPLRHRGATTVDAVELHRHLIRWVKSGLTTTAWSDYTVTRVSQGLLATLRDFAVLQGAVNKRIAPMYLPLTAFAYIAFYLKGHQPSGAKLLEHPDWRLFFLDRDTVERFLLEANQHNLLEYHAAGTVTRLTFPAGRLEEYVNVLAQRSH
jgi:hypothetical protein